MVCVMFIYIYMNGVMRKGPLRHFIDKMTFFPQFHSQTFPINKTGGIFLNWTFFHDAKGILVTVPSPPP